MASTTSRRRKNASPVPKKVRVVSSRTVFTGKVFKVTADEVVEPTGVRARRDVVRHSGSVVIAAVETSGNEPRILLARQYRYAANDVLWELPAGRIDEGEQPIAAAKRELIEETGYTARKWKRAMFFYSSPGFLDETMSVFVAEELVRGKAKPEEDELITKRLFPLSAAVRMINKGVIKDAKTIAGILWLAAREKR